MDRVDPSLPRQRNDTLDVEIGRNWPLVATDFIGFIGLEAVQAEAVLVGLDGRSAQSKFGGRPHDAGRDLASVGR